MFERTALEICVVRIRRKRDWLSREWREKKRKQRKRIDNIRLNRVLEVCHFVGLSRDVN